ncbi:MAG: hypothetical protein F6J92_35845 [Symploca sp. SIO1A3]|nr:hypothetical protein [Symploca sp. SIO1A3]
MRRRGDVETRGRGDGEKRVSEKKRGETSQQTRRRGDAETRRMKIPLHISFTREKQRVSNYRVV